MVKRESDPRGNLRKITRKSVVSGVRFTPSALRREEYEQSIGKISMGKRNIHPFGTVETTFRQQSTFNNKQSTMLETSSTDIVAGEDWSTRNFATKLSRYPIQAKMEKQLCKITANQFRSINFKN